MLLRFVREKISAYDYHSCYFLGLNSSPHAIHCCNAHMDINCFVYPRLFWGLIARSLNRQASILIQIAKTLKPNSDPLPFLPLDGSKLTLFISGSFSFIKTVNDSVRRLVDTSSALFPVLWTWVDWFFIDSFDREGLYSHIYRQNI